MNFSEKNNLATTSQNVVMKFSNAYRNRPNIIQNNNLINKIDIVKKPDTTMVWGQHIWFMLHTIAEKVYIDKFQEIRVNLLNIIYIIVTNLPCPICSDHAKEHLKSVNFNNIQNKDDLKNFLFDFHNLINARKEYEIFTYDALNEKYSNAITKNILQNFMAQFTKKTGNIRLISDDLYRKAITTDIRNFFEKNINCFLP